MLLRVEVWGYLKGLMLACFILYDLLRFLVVHEHHNEYPSRLLQAHLNKLD